MQKLNFIFNNKKVRLINVSIEHRTHFSRAAAAVQITANKDDNRVETKLNRTFI